MADLKISQLPGATTPLAGSEVLPIVQSSATKQVSIANLTAGRSISVADATLTTGNLVIGTSGKGIDFSATGQAGGMTSELLNDYEEGAFTPNLTFNGNNIGMSGTFTGHYTKVGNQVTIGIRIALTAKGSSTGTAVIGGLPFTVASNLCAVIDASTGVSGPANTWLGATSGTSMYLFYQDASNRTYFSASNFTNSADLRLGLTYLV